MKSNFINKSIEIQTFNREVFTYSYFDILGSIQTTEAFLSDLKMQYSKLEEKVDKSAYRQKEDAKSLVDIFNNLTLEKSFFEFEPVRGKIDNIPLLPEPSGYVDDFILSADLLSGNKEKHKQNLNIEIYKKGHKSVLHIEGDKKSPYTLIEVMLPEGEYADTFQINKNITDIEKIRIKKTDNTQTVFTKEMMYESYVVLNNGELFSSLFSIGKFIGFEIIIKNSLIKNNYSNFIEVSVIKEDYAKQENEISWSKGIAANKLFQGGFVLSENCPIVIGTLNVGNQSYPVQIPIIAQGTSIPVKLELEEYTKIGSDVYSIFKFPFPVDLESSLNVYSDRLFSNNVANINEYRVSFTKEVGSWVNYNNIEYSLERTKTPKYLYIRVLGFYKDLYAKHTIDFNVNCDWPLSIDRKLMFSSSGLEILNSNNEIVSFFGNVLFDKSQTKIYGLPAGNLGVD